MSGGMDELGDEVARETDEALKEEELKLLLSTRIDWERLRPQIGDQATYDALKAAVQAATVRHEGIAQLKSRLQTLGKNGFALARKVLALATQR